MQSSTVLNFKIKVEKTEVGTYVQFLLVNYTTLAKLN